MNTAHITSDLRDLWGFKSFRMRVVAAIVPTIIAIVFGALATDRVRPYEYLPDGSYIKPASGRGGDQVTVSWHVRYNRSGCTGIVERTLVDPTTDVVLAIYDPVIAVQGEGRPHNDPQDNRLNITFAMPRSIPAGWVGYRAKYTYTCNWLQELFPVFAIRYQTPMLLFQVFE